MSKNRDKNSAGSFLIDKTGKRKTGRILITTLVVIFIFGAGYFVLFNKSNKPTKLAETKIVTDELPDWWYQKYFGTNVCEIELCKASSDPDQDKLTNTQEFFYHTNPVDPFTVDDELNDGELVAGGFDPSRTGRLTFEQVTSEDNILGESLLLESDLRDIVNETKDISKIALPVIEDKSLNIIFEASEQEYSSYISDLKNKIEKYFPENQADELVDTIKSRSDISLVEINTKAELLSTELMIMRIPNKMVTYHKYLITYFELLPKVLIANDSPAFNLSTAESDAWYKNAQAFFAVSQKLNFESQRLGLPTQ